MAAQVSAKGSATLAEFLQILRLRKALIALIVSLVVLTTLGVTAMLPRWYLSTTKVRLEKPEGAVKLFQAPTSSDSAPFFLQDQLRTMPGSKSPLSNGLTFRYLLDKMLRIESQRGSSIIEIDVYAQDARLAAAIAKGVARVYPENRINFATSEQREGIAQLKKGMVSPEQEVTRQRDVVEQLQKDFNISGVDLNSRYSDWEIETLRQMQNSLIALSVDAIGRKTGWEQFRDIPQEDRINLVNAELIQDPNIQNLFQTFLVADQNVTRLRVRLGNNHPDLVGAIGNRGKIREQLDAQLSGYESSLEISSNEAEARGAELKSQFSQAKVDQILSERERVRPFEKAAHRLDDETRLLTTLQLMLRQRGIDYQEPKRMIEILNVADPANRPSRPSWPLNLSFAAIFGLIIGVGVSVLLEYCKKSFRNVSDVEINLKWPAFGVIPFVNHPARGDGSDLAEEEPFRVLPTNINLALKPGEPVALGMFSAGPSGGNRRRSTV